ncbi:hypothetical protein EMIT0P265_130149 [Pseudomonas zeae]
MPGDRALHDAILWDSQKNNQHHTPSPLLAKHGTTRLSREISLEVETRIAHLEGEKGLPTDVT